MSDVNAALSSLYLELAGELAADVNGIVRNRIADLEAELAQLRTELAEAVRLLRDTEMVAEGIELDDSDNKAHWDDIGAFLALQEATDDNE